MVSRRLVLALGVVIGLATGAHAQGPVVCWPFDEELGGWQSMDAAAKLRISHDSAVTREGGGGAAEYSYTTAIGQVAGMVNGLAEPLKTGKSLHFWLRASAPALMIVVVNEQDGSSYHAPFYSLAGVWQEMALDFTEFNLGDDSTDENQQLDVDQIAGFGLADATGFVAKVAASVPMIAAPELGARQFWVDDFAVDDDNVAPRWEVFTRDGRRAVRLESFETMPLQWLPFSGGQVKIAYDNQVHSEGDLSLRLTYQMPKGKLFGLLTNPGRAPLAGTRRLEFGVRSELATTLIVGLKERDGSQYNFLLPLAAGEGLVTQDLALADAKLSDDSQDENGKLDMDQVKEFTIADVAQLVGQSNGENRLWIDDIVFSE